MSFLSLSSGSFLPLSLDEAELNIALPLSFAKLITAEIIVPLPSNSAISSLHYPICSSIFFEITPIAFPIDSIAFNTNFDIFLKYCVIKS